MRRLALIGALVLFTSLLIGFGTPAANAADKDCGDFDTQAAAQRFFINNGGPNRDPHQLDADSDGVACESNPCPCSTNTGGGGGGGGSLPTRITQYGRVVDVTDGDTIDVRLSSTDKVRAVRLVGIDTPEVFGETECGGSEASRSMESLLPVGTRVKLASDRTQDRVDAYGRLLRYVTKTSSNQDANRAQVARGWARVYVYDNTPFERVRSYRDAQGAAQAGSRGLWGLC